MDIFEKMAEYDYEQIVFCHDPSVNLKAIIIIHDTTLGPALGGCRMRIYTAEEDAIIDCLRLSRGMTYKAAAAGLNLGGGKAVIIADPRKDKSEELLRSYGKFVNSLNGRYITAEDMGTSVEDMEIVLQETPFVTGVSRAQGGSGDPSPFTALGTVHGIKACAEEVFGSTSLEGKKIAVQGVGKVGYNLCKLLHKEEAKLVVSDCFKDRVDRVRKEFGAKAVGEFDIYSVKCDVFSPNAVGAIINDDTIPQLKCPIIAGAANNQLAETRHGDKLHEMGILYAPDYVINAGGLINVYNELTEYSEERATNMVLKIYDNVKKVIEISKRDNIPTYIAADRVAEERIAKIRSLEVLSKIDGSKIRVGH